VNGSRAALRWRLAATRGCRGGENLARPRLRALGWARPMILVLLIDLYSLILFVAVISSWLPIDPDNAFMRSLRAVTEPVLEPVRRVLPPVGGLDLSPLIVLLALRLLKAFLLGG